MTLVDVIPRNGLVLQELDLCSLLFLLVVVNPVHGNMNGSEHKTVTHRLHARRTNEHIETALRQLLKVRHELRLEYAADERIAFFS